MSHFDREFDHEEHMEWELYWLTRWDEIRYHNFDHCDYHIGASALKHASFEWYKKCAWCKEEIGFAIATMLPLDFEDPRQLDMGLDT